MERASTLRRLIALKAAAASRQETYIKDGLVLWLDGIDKGGTPGAWVDKAAGYVFEAVNGFEDGADYVGLNAASTQYLKSASFSTPDCFVGTIEVVITDYAAKSIIFMPKRNSQLAFGITTAGDGIICSTNGDMKTVNITSGAKIFSVCNNARAIIDGTAATFGSNNAWGGADNNYCYIGCRNTANPYYATAKIHAIRMYDRFLTEDEILHNQRVDNARFNLGLTI